jgi:hypothetical protein
VFFAGNLATGPYATPDAIADLQQSTTQNAQPSAALKALNTDAVFPTGRSAMKWHALYGTANTTADKLKDEDNDLTSVLWDTMFSFISGATCVIMQAAIPSDGDLVVPSSSARDGLPANAKNVTPFNNVAHVKVPLTPLEGLFSSNQVALKVKQLLTDEPEAGVFADVGKRTYGG